MHVSKILTLWGCVVANVLVLTGATEMADGDLPRILYANDLQTADSVTASSTDSGTAVAYLTDDRLDRAWQAASGTSHTIIAVWAAGVALNSVGIHGHNIGDLPAGAVSVDAIIQGDVSYSVVLGSTVLTGSRSFYRAFDPITVTALKFTITHTGAALPAVAALFAGTDFECERGLASGWSDPLLGRSPTTRPTVSRDGVPLPSTITDATLRQTFSLSNCSQNWAADTWFPFLRRCDGSAKPFMLSWGPQTFPDRACYCSGAQFDTISFSQKLFVDVGFSARMDAETGWITQP